MSSILVVTDAWHPQVNGVVRSLKQLSNALKQQDVTLKFLTPLEFRNMSMPTYPEIQLSIAVPHDIRRFIEAANCEHLHIATEGPLGWMARSAALREGRVFTTSYHTRFPEYVRARAPIPTNWCYSLMKWFHNSGDGCMVATSSLEQELDERGFDNLMRWSRGVDHKQFRPVKSDVFAGLPRPIFLNVGRVAVEKNVEAFLDLELPGSKVVVGDGPQLEALKEAYPHVVFTGPKSGEALTQAYAAADVFVFPSLTDTFGNVLLEALACGTPIAAFPVTGPLDIVGETRAGVLSQNLEEAALKALSIPPDHCREMAQRFSWEASAEQFMSNVHAAYNIGCNPTDKHLADGGGRLTIN
ncbi:glycosyltransferase family 1 protein [Rhodobacteraceae bacterium RKSG542]|uniref:glycosyltransferase family 4 protein n=1 Tax=Pseudovibrio flavus TaxID=2529854 RepID=UPI0012BB9F95|nr:glycosyltransferase family 1 protein [Pseudovibrio flavus]MTI19231.1 glycosyltransferase family 1 protein [Pseudovibrio flavus]